MFSTLTITTKDEMSNDSLWPPRGRSCSIRVETKLVTFVTGDCRGGRVANTGVRTRAVRRRLRPLCGAFPGGSHGARSCHSTHGDIALCCLSNTRPSHGNYTADHQHTAPLFTVEHFDRVLSSEMGKTERQGTTDTPSMRSTFPGG